MIGAIALILLVVLGACLAAAFAADRVSSRTNAAGTIRWGGVTWASYLFITAAPNSKGLVADVTIRWWHPGAWLMVSRALLRKLGLLPHLCARCSGNGRLMARPGTTRRVTCPECHGRRYARRTA